MRIWRRPSPRSLACEAFGVQLQVAVDDPQLLEAVKEILPPGWTPCRARKDTARFELRETDAQSYEVSINGSPWLSDATLDAALGTLDTQIRMLVAADARDWVFVHAGVVAQDGRALVIPGESFSGKTTLVAALVELGASYYSDEYAVLDEQGHVHPYPRRLSIRALDRGTTHERAAAELGGVEAQESARVAAIVVTRYRPGAEWEPTRVSTGEGVVAMLANTVPAQERPELSLRAVSRAVAGSTVLKGDRGDARSSAQSMLETLGTMALER